MAPELRITVILLVLVALVAIRWVIYRQKSPKKGALAATRGPVLQRSGQTQLQAINETYSIMGPTTIREVEDQIPTIDEQGQQQIVIRTRTLETVLGPVGPTEIERARRHTLPGHGHVSRLSDTEFEVFHNRAKLHVDRRSVAR